jgi:hypothetical protein
VCEGTILHACSRNDYVRCLLVCSAVCAGCYISTWLSWVIVLTSPDRIFACMNRNSSCAVQPVFVCRLLRQHLAELGGCADQSLEQLGLYKPDMSAEVVRLQPVTPTLLAYQQLADAGVTGAPVVSADGLLIANLSISDIRCVGRG